MYGAEQKVGRFTEGRYVHRSDIWVEIVGMPWAVYDDAMLRCNTWMIFLFKLCVRLEDRGLVDHRIFV